MVSDDSGVLRRRDLLKGVATGALSLGVSGEVAAAASGGGGNNDDYIIGTRGRAATDRAKKQATSVKREFDFGDIGKAVAGRFPPQARENLEQRPDVRYVEADGRMEAIGESLPWGINRIDADVAHDDGVTGAGADVAIIDTGIDSDHPDLQANLGTGAAFVSCDSSCSDNVCSESWDDDQGHGTHCAGIADADDNDTGVVGVGTEMTLHAVKVLDCSGYGSYSDIAAGIEYVADQQWDVASLSLGGTTSSYVLRDACQYAVDSGTLVVAAAGNNGPCTDCVLYPAKYDSVVAVSATDSTDGLASFSCTGPEIELAAPGVSILSTVPGGTAYYSGTSMACPHVSGVGGLLMANGYSNTEARARLRETAENLNLGENEQGSGLLGAQAAISDSQNMIGETGTVTVESNWQTVTLNGSYTDPVVVATVGTDNDPAPVHTRVKNVDSGSFELRLEQWEYQADNHPTETVHYFVVDSGFHSTTTGVDILAGTVQADGTGWTTANFDQTFASQRFVFTQVMTTGDPTAVSTRVTDVGLNSFDVVCQEEEANRNDEFSDHGQETVGYLVVQPRSADYGDAGESMASVFATGEWTSGTFRDSYDSTPVVLHELQSYFGRDTTDIRGRNYTVDSFEVVAQEATSANAETAHLREYVATIAFSTGAIYTDS